MNIERQTAGALEFARLQQENKPESISGPGSTERATRATREWLRRIITCESIRTIADIPCGDHNWLRHVDLTPETEYTGYDIVDSVLDKARENAPKRRFRRLNAITDIPARYDLIICRDLLVHLTLQNGQNVLENFKKSGSLYLAVTNFPNVQHNDELIESHPGWGWRPLNMQLPPFLLGPDAIDSVCEDESWQKHLTLYQLAAHETPTIEQPH